MASTSTFFDTCHYSGRRSRRRPDFLVPRALTASISELLLAHLNASVFDMEVDAVLEEELRLLVIGIVHFHLGHGFFF